VTLHSLVPASQSEVLARLGRELFSAECETLHRIAAATPLNRRALIDFDDALWGPSLSRIANNRPNAPGTLGIPCHEITRCELEDGEVFKPLHYCAVSLTDPGQDLEWEARSVVAMSSAHLEKLVGRIGGFRMLPLGNVLRKAIVRRKIDSVTWDQLWRYRGVNNAAKHQLITRLERTCSQSRMRSLRMRWRAGSLKGSIASPISRRTRGLRPILRPTKARELNKLLVC